MGVTFMLVVGRVTFMLANLFRYLSGLAILVPEVQLLLPLSHLLAVIAHLCISPSKVGGKSSHVPETAAALGFNVEYSMVRRWTTWRRGPRVADRRRHVECLFYGRAARPIINSSFDAYRRIKPNTERVGGRKVAWHG